MFKDQTNFNDVATFGILQDCHWTACAGFLSSRAVGLRVAQMTWRRQYDAGQGNKVPCLRSEESRFY